MTDKEAASDRKIMEPINIVVFVYNAQTIIGTQQNLESCLLSLIKHVRDMSKLNYFDSPNSECFDKYNKSPNYVLLFINFIATIINSIFYM